MSVRPEFTVHLLNAAGLDKARALGESFSRLLTEVEEMIPPGRERALVTTKLQEAAFWAKRGMAIDVTNQDARTA